MKKTHKIPTFFGLAIIIAGTLGGIFLVNRSQLISPHASIEISPQELKVTNISDNSFAVSFITSSPTISFLYFGETLQTEERAFDERDSANQLQEFNTHYIVIRNLKPGTRYYFRIISSGKFFDNEGQPYEITTGPVINLPLPENDTAYGTVFTLEDEPATGAIVYLNMANTVSLSALVKSDGTWLVPLSMARSTNLANYSNYDRQIQVEDVLINGGPLGQSVVTNTTDNDSPFPDIILGEDYNFSIEEEAEEEITFPSTNNQIQIQTPTPSNSPSPASKISFEEIPPVLLENVFSITNPNEGESLSVSRPEFRGIAPPQSVVEIKVESSLPYSGQVTVDSRGNWQWSPPADLSPGEHTLIASFINADGVIQKIERKFTVYAAGEENLPSYTSTPSATLSPSPTIALSPTPTSSTIIIITPTEPPKIQDPGNLTTTAFLFLGGLVLLVLGLYQFKLI